MLFKNSERLANITSVFRRPVFQNRMWWLALFALIGFCLYLRYQEQVFPAASINLKLPRSAVIKRARQLTAELGYNKLKTIESTQFTFDQEAKIFLEYVLGTSTANKLMKDDLPIWSWRTRFCRQHDQEESRIWLSPDGQLTGLLHEIENDRKLPSLSKEDALAAAKRFVENKAGLHLNSYSLTKSASINEPHRIDYNFTWEDTTHNYGGAKLRIDIGIAGNVVNQFNYFLHVPESFERKFNTLRSYNELLQEFASIFYSLLQVLSVFIFIWAFTTRRLRWRFALAVAAFMTTVDLLESLNNISLVVDSYNTRNLFAGYLTEFFVHNLSDSSTKLITYLILIGSAEFIYRINYPTKIACENFFSSTGIRSKHISNGILLGHIVLFIDLGWTIAYYFGGQWWHIWCPSEINNYQVLSSVMPCFSAIATGVSAAINEEFLYRILALSLFRRITRSFWLANILQAAAWGFMHSNYPQEPAYARGLELTASGIFLGWILRRYGILPCLIAHYLLDASMDSMPLFGAHNLAIKCSAFLPIIPFLVLYIWSLWQTKKNGYADDLGLQNLSLIDKVSPQETIAESDSTSLKTESVLSTSKSLNFRLILLTIMSLTAIFGLNNYQAVNKNISVNIGRERATFLAKEELVKRGIDPNSYKNIATLSDLSSPLEMQYIFEKEKLKRTLDLATQTGEGIYWQVRFFKPLDPKEYQVWINQSGAVESFFLIEPEDAPGAKLSADAARSKVETYLKTQHPQWQPYKFESLQENRREKRTDYIFTYTVPSLKVSEAEFQVSISALGDVVSGLDTKYDLPDEWLNERNRTVARDDIFLQMRNIFNVFLYLAGIVWIIDSLRTETIKWKLAYLLALPLIGLACIQYLNNFPQFFESYVVTLPLCSYILGQIVSCLENIPWTFLYYFCGFAAALLVLYTVPDKKKLSSINKTNAWIIALAVSSLHIAIDASADFLHIHYSPACWIEPLSSVCMLSNVAVPWLTVLTDALSDGFNNLMLLGILAGLYKRFCSSFTMYVLFIVVYNLITCSSARYWQDFVITVVFACVWEVIMWYFIVKIIRFNPYVYFLIAFLTSLINSMIEMLTHVCPIFLPSIIVIGVLIFIPALYSLYRGNNIIELERT